MGNQRFMFMEQDVQKLWKHKREVIYSDDKGVVITPLSLRVKGRLYVMEDITKFDILKMVPNRAPGIAAMLLGLGVTAGAQMKTISSIFKTSTIQSSLGGLETTLVNNVPSLSAFGATLTPEMVLTFTGVGLIASGLAYVLLRPSHYALSIVLGGEDMTVVKGSRKKYILRLGRVLERAMRRSEAIEKVQRVTRPHELVATTGAR